MKFTLSWLKTHLDTDASLAEITATLTRIGLELEHVEDRGAALASFRIARVIEAVQHPNADRLRVCTVDTGAETVRVVCGAPNARTGMKGVFAAPGTYIPGTGITLKVGEIRGVRSAGMLLSEREMGLGDDHAGIVDLPEDAPVGVPYAQWAGLDDPVIDVSVTPNRGDCFSVRGIARDLAAAGIGSLKPWRPVKVAPAFRGGPRWQIEWPEACPWILGRTIRNLRNGPSPHWLQDRLTSIGLRPINTLVDITNFFTVDLGRPLHVFDVAKLAGDVLTLRPGRGETFRALERPRLHGDAGGLRHRRCRRRAVDGRRGRRRTDRLRRHHHLGLHRVRAVRSGPRRADRPPAPDCLRRAPAVRTRHRSCADARRGGGRHRDGAGPVRRRAGRGDRSRHAAGLAAHGNAALRAHRRSRRLRHPCRRGGRLAGTPWLCRAEPRCDARHGRGAVVAQRRRGEDNAGTGRSARSCRGRKGCGRLRRDRTGMRPGRGGAAAARPRCGAARVAAACVARATLPRSRPGRSAPSWSAARSPRRVWPSVSPSASWRRPRRRCSAPRRRRCA